jgi:hypothetical protein
MIDHDAAYHRIIEDIAKLTWPQLLILQTNLSEHVLNVYQHAIAERHVQEAKAEKGH